MSDKRTKILESALQLFVEKGFQGTPTAAIARQAGVSNGTLFHYYDTKEILIRDLNTEVVSERDEIILANLDTQIATKNKIHAIWDNWINWAMRNKNKYLFLRQYGASSYQSENQQIYSRTRENFIGIAEMGIRENILGFLPADFLFELFEGNVHGMVSYFSLNQVKYRTPEFVRQSFELYWNSVKNHAHHGVLN